MRFYRVTFYRTVADDSGHDHRIREWAILVGAPSDVSAVWQAKALLCAGARVADWRLRADSCEVAALPVAA
ncbi:hypothetical protein CIW48_10860 [Methylobacterium sp. P1-11]|uniref:hypothetical protein n=1 Tax=Methylobacterium sp. P1-11 TaxID=2024616 RepID=UPI0011EC1A81|nr:hypothetical protein [Methylobacterium sp. P1-11]KAA0123968.1 hypothetical protein CIW48_10860 [Methylobacterium sp. P1-11]